MGVDAGVGDNDQARFFERASDVVCEAARSETTRNSLSAGVGSELEDSALAIQRSGDGTNIGRVVNSRDDPGSKNDLLPNI